MTTASAFARAVLPLALLFTGCSSSSSETGQASGATCPSGSTLTYDTFGKKFMESYCTRCHKAGSTDTEAAAKGDYSTLAGVQAHRDAIDSEAAAGATRTNTGMPESSPTPSDAERKQLGEWLACGAK